ncbi:MAG: BatD family protein, partial [Bacteroidetes bacterium]|nr:BatD family protein [Bacteroidota bacterium]
IVSIKGKGNFTQIIPPVIKWPAGIDAFEPVIKDSIDRLQVPLTGTKTFRYAFVSGKAGNYEIPAIELNFFNPDTNHFEKISTDVQTVQVNNEEVKKEITGEMKNISTSKNVYRWVAAGTLLMLALLAFLIRMNKQNKKKAEQLIREEVISSEPDLSIDKIMELPQMMMVADDNHFYKELNKSIWEYFRQKLHISGSAISKPLLIQDLKAAGINDKSLIDLLTIMSQCETVVYTDTAPEIQKEELFTETKKVLKAIHQQL